MKAIVMVIAMGRREDRSRIIRHSSLVPGHMRTAGTTAIVPVTGRVFGTEGQVKAHSGLGAPFDPTGVAQRILTGSDLALLGPCLSCDAETALLAMWPAAEGATWHRSLGISSTVRSGAITSRSYALRTI